MSCLYEITIRVDHQRQPARSPGLGHKRGTILSGQLSEERGHRGPAPLVRIRHQVRVVGVRPISPSSIAAMKMDDTVRITWIFDSAPSFMAAINAWEMLGRFPRSRHVRCPSGMPPDGVRAGWPGSG